VVHSNLPMESEMSDRPKFTVKNLKELLLRYSDDMEVVIGDILTGVFHNVEEVKKGQDDWYDEDVVVIFTRTE
jgi:hypothetical protein